MGSNLGPDLVIFKKTLQWFPNAAILGVRNTLLEYVEYLGSKQAKLLTMHNFDFQTKDVLSQSWLSDYIFKHIVRKIRFRETSL